MAVERCGAALLGAGRASEAVALLQPFVVEHPLREAGRIVLMRSLQAEGRTAEALEQYQVHRRELADELGLEPSPALAEAQLAVLRRSPPVVPDEAAPTTPPDHGGLTGMRVRYLRAEAGHVVAYGTAGTGPKVVVLLGWVSSLDVLASGRDPRSSLLERLTGELALTLYDRTGTGLSPGPVQDYGLEASVAELADVVRAIGPPVSLLAMSAAGPIALDPGPPAPGVGQLAGPVRHLRQRPRDLRRPVAARAGRRDRPLALGRRVEDAGRLLPARHQRRRGVAPGQGVP